jgi:hypothetical protein
MSGGVRPIPLARRRRCRAALIAFPLGRRARIRDGCTKHRDGQADVSLPARCREVQLARQMQARHTPVEIRAWLNLGCLTVAGPTV